MTGVKFTEGRCEFTVVKLNMGILSKEPGAEEVAPQLFQRT